MSRIFSRQKLKYLFLNAEKVAAITSVMYIFSIIFVANYNSIEYPAIESIPEMRSTELMGLKGLPL